MSERDSFGMGVENRFSLPRGGRQDAPGGAGSGLQGDGRTLAEGASVEGAAAGPQPEPARISDGRRRAIVGLLALVAATAIIVVLINRTSTPKPEAQDAASEGVTVPQGAVGIDKTTGLTWQAVKGSWLITGGRLTVNEQDAEFFGLLITQAESGNVAITVRCPVIVNGTAIVFRYENPLNYWEMQAVPSVASWQVWKVVDGAKTYLGDTGLSPTGAGTVIGVTTGEDGKLAISFFNRVQKTYSDLALAKQHGFGVAAIGLGSAGSTFTRFKVTAHSSSPSTSAASG